jgi:hypoxanthine phosphoribosyltransferase
MKSLNWNEVQKAAENLAKKIKKSGFKPDYLIGITTGGLYPLALLAKKLDCKSILTISAKSESKDGKKRVEAIYLPKINLKRKRVLLIDDITNSGATLIKISNIITEHYQPKALRTATLGANMDMAKTTPDYYELVEKGDWIKFPWEDEKFNPYPKKGS